MRIFPTGIQITDAEHKSILHIVESPEQWLLDTLNEKARLRREALINEWRSRLFADPTVIELPADANAFVALVMARPDYRSRTQADAETVPPVIPIRHNTTKFESRPGRGRADVSLFPTGIEISQLDVDGILAYVQDLNDWILGALVGQINRGKKKIIRQYQPVLMSDPDVITFPANEEGLIEVITARADYKTLPEQFREQPVSGV